ncbi:MAG: peptidylprolyl isomerase [Bacteroidota bacterium]
MKRIGFLILLITVLFACSEKKNIFEDNDIRHIADLQDRRKTDSLLLYLKSDNVEQRKRAAIAFASVQDTTTIAELWKVPDVEAVYSLGQMYAFGSYYPLKEKISKGNAPGIRREAFEAFGKVLKQNDIEMLYDSTNAEGVAWGIYRAGIRGVTDSVLVKEAAAILSNKNSTRDDRLAAAHFFARSKVVDEAAVIAATADSDAEIRMAAVSALSKIKDETTVTKAIKDEDYRVRVSAARALRTKRWKFSKSLFAELLHDTNPNVSIAAAEVVSNIDSADWQTLSAWANEAKNWRVSGTLFEAAAKKNKDVLKMNGFSNNLSRRKPYELAAVINAMSQDPSRTGEIVEMFKNAKVKVVKSTAATALARMTSDLEIFKMIITDGDQGAIIPVCNAIIDTTRGFKKIIKDYSFLEEAKSRLSLPRDYETYAPLEEAINYLKGLPPPEPLKNEYNHPIDWALALTIPKDQKVLVKTSKGDIVMQLFIEEAPGSVVNFVQLVKTGYYNGKFFHRVVPNFVIQTGCNRGDGFGSEDYSIRSEFSQRKYKTGSVGMASAGKDTEGTQWFITHSPTPHLDGKYTIFAEVVSGMDVVHQIEVGDKIIEARLISDDK